MEPLQDLRRSGAAQPAQQQEVALLLEAMPAAWAAHIHGPSPQPTHLALADPADRRIFCLEPDGHLMHTSTASSTAALQPSEQPPQPMPVPDLSADLRPVLADSQPPCPDRWTPSAAQLSVLPASSHCPPRTSSDVTRADMGLQLLSSRRDIAKLKWQHRLHGLSADRLERVLYDRGLPAPAQARGRHRRTWRQVVDSIYGLVYPSWAWSLYPCLVRSSLEAFAVQYMIGTMLHSLVCWLAGRT